WFHDYAHSYLGKPAWRCYLCHSLYECGHSAYQPVDKAADLWTGGAARLNESVRMVVVLAVIAMVSGGLLAVVYDWTSAIIAENQLREMESSVFEVLTGAARIELLDTA